MTSLIKEFVETNIEIIENNKWFLLFMNWYNNPHKEFPDTNEWNELIEVLQHIDRNILETTKTQREGVIITITRGTIDEIKRNEGMWANGKKISLSFLLMDLYSTLGLSREDILNCIQDAAKYENLSYDDYTEIFTWS